VVRLGEFRGHVPVVVEFGSFTCPYCTVQCGEMDALARRYDGKVAFLFVYGEEAHYGTAILPNEYAGDRSMFTDDPTDAQRRAAADTMRSELEVHRPMLLAPTGNDLRAKFLAGRLGNPGFVVDPAGRIVFAARWLKARQLDEYLQAYLDSGGATPPVADEAPTARP